MDGMKMIPLSIYEEYSRSGDASLCGVAIEKTSLNLRLHTQLVYHNL